MKNESFIPPNLMPATTIAPLVIRLPEAMRRTGLKRSTIYSLMSQGAFPQSIKLGSKSVGWHSSKVDEWIASRPSGVNLQVAASDKGDSHE